MHPYLSIIRVATCILLLTIAERLNAEDEYLFPEAQVNQVLGGIDDPTKRAEIKSLLLDPRSKLSEKSSRDLKPYNDARAKLMSSGIPSAQALSLIYSLGRDSEEEEKLTSQISWSVADLDEVFSLLVSCGLPLAELDSEAGSVVVAQSRILGRPIAQTLKIPPPGKPTSLSPDGLRQWLAGMVATSLSDNQWDTQNEKALHELEVTLTNPTANSVKAQTTKLGDLSTTTFEKTNLPTTPLLSGFWVVGGIIAGAALVTLLFLRRKP